MGLEGLIGLYAANLAVVTAVRAHKRQEEMVRIGQYTRTETYLKNFFRASKNRLTKSPVKTYGYAALFSLAEIGLYYLTK